MNKKGVRKQNRIYDRIRSIIVSARNKALYAVNTEMVQAYWLIGKEIVEEEQKGERRAEYGKALIENLSLKLTDEFGEGFTTANMWNIRQFYLIYPKLYAVRRELTWTHYRLLMRVEDKQARSFYDKNEAVVQYTLPKGEKRIFTSKYKLYLPTRQELIAELKKERFLLEQNRRLEGC